HTRYWRDWSSDVCSSDLVSDQLPDARGISELAQGFDCSRCGRADFSQCQQLGAQGAIVMILKACDQFWNLAGHRRTQVADCLGGVGADPFVGVVPSAGECYCDFGSGNANSAEGPGGHGAVVIKAVFTRALLDGTVVGPPFRFIRRACAGSGMPKGVDEGGDSRAGVGTHVAQANRGFVGRFRVMEIINQGRQCLRETWPDVGIDGQRKKADKRTISGSQKLTVVPYIW